MLEFFTRKHPVHVVISGLMLFVLVSCGGSSEDDAPVAGTCDSSQATVTSATFDQLWTNVFSNQCGSCHGVGATGTAGGPDMRTPDAFYSGLVGKDGSSTPEWETYESIRGACLSYQFIQSRNANQSVVMAVLDSSVSLSGCTIKFHRNADPQNVCITDANLVKLREWINAGANR
ncbi:MAG: hypothetical protein V4655_11905 [Bdellovibrionota bacterium]|nr:MAG: hypothetical protein EOP09_16135 [Pseudomonadota bacterium]